MTNFETGQLEVRPVSTPDEWTRPPAFPSGAGGLVSTVDDFLVFARLLLNKGAFEGGRLLCEKSVELMTTNHLTQEQMAGGGILLAARNRLPGPGAPASGAVGWVTTWAAGG